jgi:hypothetical protein
MVFEDVNSDVFEALEEEWKGCLNGGEYSWGDFLKHKDLGIEFIWESQRIDKYTIVDYNKWMLTRIRYGI